MQYDLFVDLTLSDLLTATRRNPELRARIKVAAWREVDSFDKRRVYYSPRMNAALTQLFNFVLDWGRKNVPSYRDQPYMQRFLKTLNRLIRRIVLVGYTAYEISHRGLEVIYANKSARKGIRDPEQLRQLEAAALIEVFITLFTLWSGKSPKVDGVGRNLI